MIVNDLSKIVVLLPIPWSDARKVELDQNVYISSEGIDKIIEGRIISKDNIVTTIHGLQYLFVTIISEEINTEYKSGLLVGCKIQCGKTNVFDSFKKLIHYNYGG